MTSSAASIIGCGITQLCHDAQTAWQKSGKRVLVEGLIPAKAVKAISSLDGFVGVWLRHFFIVPPGLVASPVFSAEPAVPAPCVLASRGEGVELEEFPVVGLMPPELPPVAGVC